VAHHDEDAVGLIDSAATKVLSYIDHKAAHLEQTQAKIAEVANDDLSNLKVDGSGGVGEAATQIRKALSGGSFGSKFAHVSNFINKTLKKDLVEENTDVLNGLFAKSGINPDSIAMKKAFFDNKKSKEENLKSPVKVSGEAVNQGHHRTRRHPGQPQNEEGDRTTEEMRKEGLTVSDDEVKGMFGEDAFEKDSDPTQQKTNWKEGVRVWAMNERSKWVMAMRELSLPVGAGVSGTTARMVKGLEQMGIGDPEYRRLACIGYLIPFHHHSLVEIMCGASGNGGPAFSPSQQMYREIAPYSEDQLRSKVGPFPDEG
jgi:hypothetical protein